MAEADLEPGTVIGGDFTVVKKLAKGGMGAVYQVDQASTGKRRALKIMLASRAENADLRRRFEQEAKIASQIQSDHVVDVIAAGVDDATDAPWLAMELLEGEDLAATLKTRGHLSMDEARELFAELFHAVGAAHDIPIVHRDLKPENIFLARPRRVGVFATVKVLDFGLAKILRETSPKSTTNGLGTPLWMAPEQMAGKQGVRPATDVWALALIVYRVLTGHYFWKAATDPDANALSVLHEACVEEFVDASVRAREQGVADRLPPMFDEWFRRCMAREFDDRFPDARAAWSALAPLLGSTSQPVNLSMAPRQPSVPPPPSAALTSSSQHGPASQRKSSPSRTSVPNPPSTLPSPELSRASRRNAVVVAILVVAALGMTALVLVSRARREREAAPPAPTTQAR